MKITLAIETTEAYTNPSNVREILEMALEEAGMVGTAKLIQPDFVPEPFRYRGAKRAQETCKYTLKMEE